MKALELTAYPPIPPDPYQSGHLMHNEAEVEAWEYARYKEDLAKYRKRLTDAELAAEFHKSTSDFMSANTMDLLFDDADSAERLERARVWMFHMESFATLPHYDAAKP